MLPKLCNVQLAAARKSKRLKKLSNVIDNLSISLETIRCYARKTWRFMDVYRKGLTGIEALYAVKKYSHIGE